MANKRTTAEWLAQRCYDVVGIKGVARRDNPVLVRSLQEILDCCECTKALRQCEAAITAWANAPSDSSAAQLRATKGLYLAQATVRAALGA